MDEEKEVIPEKKNLSDVLNKYKNQNEMPKATSSEQYQKIMNKETDPDLMTVCEIIDLPSKGVFYENKLSQLDVEYMTSIDEDLITTPSLIENGKVLDVLLKRKIKTKGIDINNLLPGDRNAVLLFLRKSSYGPDYPVEVIDPRTDKPFKTTVDLNQLKYKEFISPNESSHFLIDLPMRKKTVEFRLLTTGEDNLLFEKATNIKEAYSEEFSKYNTMKLQASVVSIDGNSDRKYINKFVEVMPALDSLTLRKEINRVSPDVDMSYNFITKDGEYTFTAKLQMGMDFFFPNL